MDYSHLEEENKRLKAELEKINSRKKEKWNKRAGLAKRSSVLFLGKNLKNSITNLFTEIEEKRSISKETLSDLFAAIFMRVTRIGFFLIITTLLPTLFILFQVYLLKTQNNLIEGQNNRLDQQTYLQEAERRSSMMLVLDQTMQQIIAEGYRNDGKLSQASKTRLIALSKILKPYRYLDNDTLTNRVVSLERGYMLLSLLESNIRLKTNIDVNSKKSLIEAINFEYAELTNAEINDLNLRDIQLKNVNLNNSNLIKSYIQNCNFFNASLIQTDFSGTDINKGTNFNSANLTNATFSGASFNKVSFKNALLKNTNFKNADLIKVDFTKATIIGAKFDNATISPPDFELLENGLDSKNADYLNDNYRLKVNKGKGIIVAK